MPLSHKQLDYATNTILTDLQKLEAGLITELTPCLIDTIENNKITVRAYYKSHHKYPNRDCLICHTDIAIGHHVSAYKGQRSYNGDMAPTYIGCIGYTFICPNCHHRIHNVNPYFKG